MPDKAVSYCGNTAYMFCTGVLADVAQVGGGWLRLHSDKFQEDSVPL